MTNAVAIYAVVVGALMAVWWAIALRGAAWDRGDRAHAELGLHLGAELLTAAALVVSGLLVLVDGPPGETLLAGALGMLLYTTIASPGYFLARRELPVAGMFAALAGLTAVGLAVLIV